jgi:hypothetical protein
MTPEARSALVRLTAVGATVLETVESRVRRIEERQEWERRHSRPETPHERERRERGLW